jgi:ribosomal protein L11
MYIRNEFVFDKISERVSHIQNCLNEINNLMPDDLTYKTLRELAKEIIETARELKTL